MGIAATVVEDGRSGGEFAYLAGVADLIAIGGVRTYTQFSTTTRGGAVW